jgi:hypothetical protein
MFYRILLSVNGKDELNESVALLTIIFNIGTTVGKEIVYEIDFSR